MKFHLPLKLRSAILAAIALGSVMPASALYVVGVSKTTNDATELLDTVTRYPGYDIREYVRPAVVETTNDAPVQLTPGGTEKTYNAYMPIYVREGTLVMTDGIQFNYLEPDNGCMLQVAGRDAKMVISNDASFAEEHTYLNGYVNIGGPDGAGTLILESGGSIHLDKSLTAGYFRDADWSSSQTVFATYDGSNRYADGQYELVTYTPTGSGETTRYYGKAVIEVNGDSNGEDSKNRTTLEMGTAMFLAHADVTIKNGGLLLLGTKLTDAQNNPDKTYNGWEGQNILGRQNGCTTNFCIENGGEVDITGSLVVGASDMEAVKVNISVDGKASQTFACGVAEGSSSKLSVSHVLGLGVGASWGTGGSSTTSMTVTNGGEVVANDVRLGIDSADDRMGNHTVALSIDEASSLKANSIRLGKGATVVNRGSVERIPAAVAMYASRSNLPPMVVGNGASWTNSGSLAMDVNVQSGGTFITENGSTVQGLSSEKGASITLNGNSTFNGDVSISESVLTFGSGAAVTVNGAFVIDSASTVYVQLDGNDSPSATLFSVSSWNENADAPIAITLLNVNGEKCGWGYAQITENGNVSIGQSAAQTLSLNNNQKSFYAALQKMSAGGSASQIVNNLLMSQNEAEVKAALDSMSGHEYATAMSSQIEGNLGHLRRLRGAMGKGSALDSSVATPCAPALDAKGNEVMTSAPAVTDARNWRVGVSAFHEETNIDSDAHGDGYNRSETGAMLNGEYSVSEDLTLGGALSYGRTNLRTDGAVRRHEDNTRFDVYALYGKKRWSFATSLGLGMHEHELLGGDVDGYSINFLQDAAYTVLNLEKDKVQVFGTIESSWNEIDSCSDGLIAASSQDAWATEVTAGVRYNRTLCAFGNAPAGVFTAQTGVTASIGDIQSGVDMSINGYGYRQESATRNRWGWNLGAGVDVPVRANVSIYGTVDAVLRGDSSSVDGQVGVRVAF